MSLLPQILEDNAGHILDSLHDGVYVTDTERRILYWSESARRITGWPADQVVGKRCCDNVLCHIDKDGNHLCGEAFCPLHRSMLTGESNVYPVVLYAQNAQGKRVPLEVSVAPIRNKANEIIGGVEAFRDFSAVLPDLERAQKIQKTSFESTLPLDPRITFTAHYRPLDILGGDFYAVEQLDENRFAFLLADVMGHGISAALHTMHLHALWKEYGDTLKSPEIFLERLNRRLIPLLTGDMSFATGLCGLIDFDRKRLTYATAAAPMPLYRPPAGSWVSLPQQKGLPLGLLDHVAYTRCEQAFKPGDTFLFYTDGATEIPVRGGGLLGKAGLTEMLNTLGIPEEASFSRLEEALLNACAEVRLPDDFTLLAVGL